MAATTKNYYASDTWRDYRDEVKRMSYGNWDSVLSEVAPDLKLAIERFGKHVPCPRHGGTDGFRLFNDFRMKGSAVCNSCGVYSDGFEVLQWLYGWNFAEALRNVGDAVGVTHPQDKARGKRAVAKIVPVEIAPRRSPEEVAIQDASRAARLSDVWEATCGLMEQGGEVARQYLKNRAITESQGPLDDLRVHPGLPYFENNTNLGSFPALIALMRQPNGQPCTVQRIYLTPDGHKAPVEAPKKVMPRRSTVTFNGSAVRLDHLVGSVLIATEGVETGLASRAMMGFPTWASTVSGLLEGMQVPDQARVIVIFGDKDRPRENHERGPGYSAAAVLATRLREEGRKVCIALPPYAIPAEAKSLDWANVLESYGLEAARNLPFILNARATIAEELQKLGLSWESAHAHY